MQIRIRQIAHRNFEPARRRLEPRRRRWRGRRPRINKFRVNIKITAMHRNAAAKLHRRCFRNSQSRRRFSAGFNSVIRSGFDAANHSRNTASAATPRITTKKKTSFRTIGPIVAISSLLDQIHCASLNSCTPVNAKLKRHHHQNRRSPQKIAPKEFSASPGKRKAPPRSKAKSPSPVPIHTSIPALESSTARKIKTSSAPSRSTIVKTKIRDPNSRRPRSPRA